MEKSKNILIYDRAYLPLGLSLKQILDRMNNDGIVDYCSCASGNYAGKNISTIPRVISRDSLEDVDGMKFIDLSKED